MCCSPPSSLIQTILPHHSSSQHRSESKKGFSASARQGPACLPAGPERKQELSELRARLREHAGTGRHASACARVALFMALRLLWAIFKWALRMTHFSVRTPGPGQRQKPGESHIHSEEHRSALPTQPSQAGRKLGLETRQWGVGWGGSKFSKSSVRHGCRPWRPVASGGCHSLS